MKELIKLFYNFEYDEIEENNQEYLIKKNNVMFLFYPVMRSLEEINSINQISQEMKNMNILTHSIVLNKQNQIITKYNEKEYILLKIEENASEELNLMEILDLSNKLQLSKSKEKEYKNNWGNMWSQKVDYFEYQIHELGKNKKIILNSFSYYIGLAENAICYVNNTNNKYERTALDRIVLSHKRIQFPNEKKDFLNPMTFIFDLEVRDVASYIKSAFFQDEKEAWIEFKTFLSMRKLSIYGYQMFYARLLYPSYYFDLYEEIMNNEMNEEKLLKIIDHADNYEKFLKRVFLELCKYAPIEPIDWIVNKKL